MFDNNDQLVPAVGDTSLESKISVVPVPKEEDTGLTHISSLQKYLSEIRKYPLLTTEDRYNLFVRYKEYGDLDAAMKLATSSLRLVVKIAMEYHRTYMSLLDLIQEGNIGLLKAIEKFDPYKGTKFSTYAAWWI